ncbi:MAG: ATP-binding protein [Candidatus Electrothrix sp. AR3]|nr:ATP-binding protein [Candidatus Electrothrix sp. AR3]
MRRNAAIHHLHCFAGTTNRRDDMDEAFARRFESIIYFPVPRPEERLRLWQQGFSEQARLAEGVDLNRIAKEHALAEGAIMNVIRYASLQALKQGGVVITPEAVQQRIRHELAKEGKR